MLTMLRTMNATNDQSFASKASYSPGSRSDDVIEGSRNYIPTEHRSENLLVQPTIRRNVVMDANENDIFCSKDKSYDKNKGNRSFNDLIMSYSMAYRAAEGNKTLKMGITKEILAVTKTRFSRFLEAVQDDDGRIWEEINNQKARDKISHALRYALKCQNSFNEDSSSRKSSSSSTSGSTARKGKSHSASAISKHVAQKSQSSLFVPPPDKLASLSTLLEQADLSNDSTSPIISGQSKQPAVFNNHNEITSSEANILGGYNDCDLCDENSTTSYSFSALVHFPSLLLGNDELAKSVAAGNDNVDNYSDKKFPNEICFDNSVRSEDLNMLINEPLDDFDWHTDERNEEFLSLLRDDDEDNENQLYNSK